MKLIDAAVIYILYIKQLIHVVNMPQVTGLYNDSTDISETPTQSFF